MIASRSISLHGIQSLCIAFVSPLVSSCDTFAKAWVKLVTTYANHSTSHMIGLLNALTKVNEEGKTILEYMKLIKIIIDNLTMIDHFFSDGEIVVYTSNGLTFDFKELSATIRVHDSGMSFQELHDKILDRETFL